MQLGLLLLVTSCTLLAGCSASHPDNGRTTLPANPASPSAARPSSGSTTASPPTHTSNANSAHLVYRSGIATPDPDATPGSALDGVTTGDICAPGWNKAHKTIGHRVQNEVSARYGVIAGPGTTYHLDQLIPASLGGDATERNVWPQPEGDADTPGVTAKKLLDSRLHQLVCQGQLSLTTAQQTVAADWTAALKTYVPSAGN